MENAYISNLLQARQEALRPQTSGDYMLAIHNRLATLPAVCSESLEVDAGKGRFFIGGQATTDLNKHNSLKVAYGSHIFKRGSVSADVSGSGLDTPSLSINSPVPGTPLSAGFNLSPKGNITGVQVGIQKGKFTATVTANISSAYGCPE
jgi:hypothetical protein